jgi:hypothetical protein
LEDEEHRDGDDHEGMAARAQRDGAEGDRDDTGDETAERNQKEWDVAARDVPVLAEDRQRIGARAEERGVSERDVAGIAREDVPGGGHACEHECEDGHGGECGITEDEWEGDGSE